MDSGHRCIHSNIDVLYFQGIYSLCGIVSEFTNYTIGCPERFALLFGLIGYFGILFVYGLFIYIIYFAAISTLLANTLAEPNAFSYDISKVFESIS